MVVELVAGLLTNSLALVADAVHMASDVAALGLSLAAVRLAAGRHTRHRTFGLHRVEVLAAFLNGVALWILVVYMSWKAVERLGKPPEIHSGPMLAVAVVGLIVNLISLRLLGGHRHGSLNTRGAFLHVVGDALGSVGAILAALAILATGWTPADAVVTLLISALIVGSAWRLIKETAGVLLEISPRGLDMEGLRRDLETVEGVEEVHDLHVWTVTSGFVSMSCHARLHASGSGDRVVRDATRLLRERHGITHATIQPETDAMHGEASEADPCCLGEHRPAHEPSRIAC